MAQVPRIAVIGAGPSGLYTAEALLKADPDVTVDVIDRLPAPYGLVRYGVAPDHLKMKSVVRALVTTFDDAERVRFLGNVRVGEDGIPGDVLREHYHAVVYASGSSVDRELGVPGEDLAGNFGSGAFVSWYCGHPDFTGLAPDLSHPGAVVVGAGNVALDVARVLARPAQDLAGTDAHDEVVDALAASAISDVHVVIRRGPQHVKFTPAELRQIGKLDDVEVLVHDDGVLAAGVEEPAERRMRQNLEMLTEWVGNPPGAGGSRRIHLHFLRSPVAVLGEQQVSGIELVHNTLDAEKVRATDRRETIDAGLVVRAIGYVGEPISGLPFDEASGTVPHEAGRVMRPAESRSADAPLGGEPVPGCYVAGWIKRGPSGVIGTNKGDGAETAASVLADLPRLAAPVHPERDSITERLREYGIEPVGWESWLRLDAEEIRLGEQRGGTERVKIAERDAMLEAARGSAVQGSAQG